MLSVKNTTRNEKREKTGNENILFKTKIFLKTEIYYLLNTEKYFKIYALQIYLTRSTSKFTLKGYNHGLSKIF